MRYSAEPPLALTTSHPPYILLRNIYLNVTYVDLKLSLSK